MPLTLTPKYSPGMGVVTTAPADGLEIKTVLVASSQSTVAPNASEIALTGTKVLPSTKQAELSSVIYVPFTYIVELFIVKLIELPFFVDVTVSVSLFQSTVAPRASNIAHKGTIVMSFIS